MRRDRSQWRHDRADPEQVQGSRAAEQMLELIHAQNQMASSDRQK
jgi:hypothetical protein